MQRLDGQWTEEIGRGTDSGWVRSITLRSDKDPQEWYELVFFESEAKARANEKTPKHELAFRWRLPRRLTALRVGH